MMVMAGSGSLWTRGKREKYSPQAWNISSSLHSDCFNLCHMHNNYHQGDARHSLTPLIIQGGRNVGTSVMSTTPASQEHPPQIEFFLPPQLKHSHNPFHDMTAHTTCFQTLWLPFSGYNLVGQFPPKNVSPRMKHHSR